MVRVFLAPEPIVDSPSSPGNALFELIRVVKHATEFATLPNVISLARHSFKIGSAKQGNDIQLEHPFLTNFVSRYHAKFGKNKKGDGYIIDRRSTNGTFVNGTKLVPFEKRFLFHGDCITFGDRFVIIQLKHKNKYIPNCYSYVYQRKMKCQSRI